MSTSSPVFAITTRSSGPTTSSIPRASFAPPVPPASTTTGPPLKLPRSQARDLDAGPDLVPDVDRDDQRGQLLDDPRRLQRPAVDGPEALDPLHDPGHP